MEVDKRIVTNYCAKEMRIDMDKHFEDMMRKKVELDRLNTEREAIEFWHQKLLEAKKRNTLDALQSALMEIIHTMENRMNFLEKEKRKMA